MSIRLKFFVASVVVVLAAFFITQHILVQYVVYPQLESSGQELGKWGTARVAKLVTDEVQRVEALTTYLAAQEDMRQVFADDGIDGWPTQCSVDRLAVDRLNLIYILDTHGRVVRQRYQNDAGGELAIPPLLPEKTLPLDHPLLGADDGQVGRAGLLPTALAAKATASRRRSS